MTGDIERDAFGRVCLRQIRRKLQGLAAVGQHVLISYIQIAIKPEERLAVGDSSVGPGISRVELGGPGEQSSCRLQKILGAPAHRELCPGLEIESVSLRIQGRARRDGL